jgi:hypothetical protein
MTDSPKNACAEWGLGGRSLCGSRSLKNETWEDQTSGGEPWKEAVVMKLCSTGREEGGSASQMVVSGVLI